MAFEAVDEIADRMISRLKKVDLRDQQPLNAEEIMWLIEKSTTLFKSQPVMAEIDAPVTICGDTHGQFPDVLEIFERNYWPPKAKYVFLGDYVDRGEYSVHTIALLFALKIRYPKSVYLLRGNHETPEVNSRYGFKEEIGRRYGNEGDKIYARFNMAFADMSIAALVSSRILCMHGGLSPHLNRLRDIRQILRPIRDIPKDGLVTDLLWADPKENVKGFLPNPRGISVCFGGDTVHKFCDDNQVDMVVRAHEVVPNGFLRQFDNRIVTIFTARDYGGGNNDGAVLVVKENLSVNFEIIPSTKRATGPRPLEQLGIQR